MALSTEDIDREIDSRTKEVAAMSTTLVELDNHPGLQHVRRYPPQGVTARRWAEVEPALTQLWEDLGRMTTILESVRSLRSGNSRLDEAERAELTRLLREPSLEVARHRVPFAQRKLTGPGETVEYVGLADTADRMRDAYPGVAEFLDHVDADELPDRRQVGSGAAEARRRRGCRAPKEVGELLAVSATDPLSLSTAEVEERIRVIADDVDRRSAELAELAALRANWGAASRPPRLRLHALHAARAEAARATAEAERTVVSGPLPGARRSDPGLRAELNVDHRGESGCVASRFAAAIDAAMRVARERSRNSHRACWIVVPNSRDA